MSHVIIVGEVIKGALGDSDCQCLLEVGTGSTVGRGKVTVTHHSTNCNSSSTCMQWWRQQETREETRTCDNDFIPDLLGHYKE